MNIKKILFLSLAMIMAVLSVHGQVPNEVKEVMRKCEAAMSSPQGVEIDMNVKTSLAFVKLMNMHLVTGEKGSKSKAVMTMSILGKEVTIESGFDGEQEWVATDDTVTITKTTTKGEGDSDLNFNLANEYKKAKMKLKNDYYEIDFSNPVDKNNEAKSVSVKVSKKDYRLREMKMSMKGAKATITINKVRFGLKDDYFKLDLSKYPKAKVIRK